MFINFRTPEHKNVIKCNTVRLAYKTQEVYVNRVDSVEILRSSIVITLDGGTQAKVKIGHNMFVYLLADDLNKTYMVEYVTSERYINGKVRQCTGLELKV